jgi:predicted DNA-binding ribbon-helix-helix protein
VLVENRCKKSDTPTSIRWLPSRPCVKFCSQLQIYITRLCYTTLVESQMREKSPRNIFIHGHPTSMRIEPEIWQSLKEMAAENGVTIKALVEKIAIAKKPNRTLSSEIRVFVAGYFAESSPIWPQTGLSHRSLLTAVS